MSVIVYNHSYTSLKLEVLKEHTYVLLLQWIILSYLQKSLINGISMVH